MRNCHILIIWVLAVTLALKIANQPFCMHSDSWWCTTIPSLVTKCLVVQKISSGQTLTFGPFAVTLALNALIQIFNKTFWLTMIYDQTRFSCQRISSSEDIVERIIFWSYEPSLWPWTCYYNNNKNLHDALAHDLHHHTKFGNKMFCGPKIIIHTNIHWHFEPSMWPWPCTQ